MEMSETTAVFQKTTYFSIVTTDRTLASDHKKQEPM